MEFVPRHPHAIPPATSPDRLPCGAAVRRPSPLSSPDRVPAHGGTPPGHRQTTTPLTDLPRPPVVCWPHAARSSARAGGGAPPRGITPELTFDSQSILPD